MSHIITWPSIWTGSDCENHGWAIDSQRILFSLLAPDDILTLKRVSKHFARCVSIYCVLRSFEKDAYGNTLTQRIFLQSHFIQSKFSYPPSSKVSFGDNHLIMCLPNHSIVSKGNNYFGQLGNHERNVSVYMHKHPITVSKIHRDDMYTNKVVASHSCSFLLTSSGTIYSWGKNKNGILGLNHHKMTIIPTQISPALHLNIPIATIDVHSNTAIALTTSGGVYTWGVNAKFTPKSCNHIHEGVFTSVNHPILVPELNTSNPDHNIIDVCAGNGFFLALTKDKVNLLTWGHSCCYNLSKRSHKSIGINRVRGMRLGLGRYITSFSAGSEHALASLSVGQVYSWGNHESGALGRRQNSDVYHPQPIERNFPSISKVSAGTYHSLYLSQGGDVYISGRFGGKKNFHPVMVANNIVDIRCTMYNAIMINTLNEIFVWGANDNGQIDTQPEHTPIITTPIKFEL